jgi:hypothetical protein
VTTPPAATPTRTCSSIGTTGPALRQIGEAKRVCRTCPAQTQCLAWALDNRVIDGVWGGTTGEERHAMRSLPRRMTTSQEDDDGEGHQPTEHGAQGIHAQAAQGKATRISAALELAMNLVLREPRSREIQRDVSASATS